MSELKGDTLVLRPAQLLQEHVDLLVDATLPGPVLDLACGEGRNGIFVAKRGLSVTCCDRSQEVLKGAQQLAREVGVTIELWEIDLEQEDENPLPEDAYGLILVFRYLHRPLMPCIGKALKQGGILIYETFTVEQRRFGKPNNPDFLLKAGELSGYFGDWEIIHYFEGIKENPKRAVAQIVCRKSG